MSTRTAALTAVFAFLPALVFAYGQQRGPATLHVSNQGGYIGECTQEHPCRDLAQALQFALPGDTVVLQAGEYPGFRLEGIRATEDKPFVIKGVGKVRILPNSELRDPRDNIQISNCDWIRIENIQSFDAPRAGIRIDQSHHVTVRDSVFGNNGTWGIFANHSNDLVLENNDCFGSKKQHGIYDSNSGDRPVIRGNRVHANAGSGIQLNGDLSAEGGRDVAGDGVISGAVIENNVISDNGKSGGAAINCDGVLDAVIQGNELSDNHASGITLFKGDGATGPGNVKVDHNMIDMAPDSRWAVIVKDTSGSVVITNNTFITRRRGALSIGSRTDLGNIHSDHNIFSGQPGVASVDDGDTAMSFADWQKHEDQHSVFKER